MDITDYRIAVRAALAAAGDAAAWPDDLLDAGLAAALAEYQAAAPPVEASFIAEASGHSHSIGKLLETGLARLAGLAWPWTAADGHFEARRWTLQDATTVRFLDVAPAVGDEIRARYWRIQTIAGLDGAAATTVPAADAGAMARGAAGWAAHLRCRQLSEAGAAPATALPGLWQWQAAARADYQRWLADVAAAAAAGSGPAICWPMLGL